MSGLAPAPHDSGAMRGRRMIAGGQRGLRHAVPGRTRSHMSQPASEVRRQAPQQNQAPQQKRQAAQAGHHRDRQTAHHHRKRSPEDCHAMAASNRRIDTALTVQEPVSVIMGSSSRSFS